MHEPRELIATGRAADVYAFGDGRVLRRYRTDHDCLYEAAVMQHVCGHGYPAPEVFEASGRDLVMQRVDGPTMLDDFARHPWRLFAHAATLAKLLAKLHEIPPAPWMRPRIGRGETVVHMDLHPDNVMLSEQGPVVIDWTNAGRGDADAEIADLWLVFSSATVPGNRFERALINAGRGVFVRAFLRHFDRDAVRHRLADACAARSHDRNMSGAEIERMRRLVERYG